MRHLITIRDVSLVHAAVSCLGTADLRDAALAAAPHAAPAGATKEEVARTAASLIVLGTGGDPAEHGLPEVPREALDRAATAMRARYADAGPSAGDEAAARRLAEAERHIAALEREAEAMRTKLADLASENADLNGGRDELGGRVASLDRAVTLLEGQRAEAASRAASLQTERDALASKLASCEAALGQVSEQLAAAQAPAPAETPSKKR